MMNVLLGRGNYGVPDMRAPDTTRYAFIDWDAARIFEDGTDIESVRVPRDMRKPALLLGLPEGLCNPFKDDVRCLTNVLQRWVRVRRFCSRAPIILISRVEPRWWRMTSRNSESSSIEPWPVMTSTFPPPKTVWILCTGFGLAYRRLTSLNLRGMCSGATVSLPLMPSQRRANTEGNSAAGYLKPMYHTYIEDTPLEG